MTDRARGSALRGSRSPAKVQPGLTGGPSTLGVGHRDGIDLWYDVHGAGDSAVLLLAGAACQATQWEPAFFEPLVDIGHRVVRFDWRDTGLSTWGDFRSRPYTVDDLVDDAIAVLDDAGIASADFVGFSMGGLVAQGAAVHHPERVRSLALLAAGYYGGMLFEDTEQSRALGAFLMRPRPEPDDSKTGSSSSGERSPDLASTSFRRPGIDGRESGWRGVTTRDARISRSLGMRNASACQSSVRNGERSTSAGFDSRHWSCTATTTGCSPRATVRRSPRPSPEHGTSCSPAGSRPVL
jgi:pimeloyl-ACP methyl ester carboxylesterase